ncbi:unnamed protein product [Allacma fusca]|uniref:Uncharacterized protein n=1 Tax=Allacma fusca TaxID=39272 RepID=A0A8J2L0P0_9HEXA|nr:unnamed protein product [Allacma fusca]
MSAPEETSLGRNEGSSGQEANASHSNDNNGNNQGNSSHAEGVRHRNGNQGFPSSAPTGNSSNQQGPRVTRNNPVIPPAVTDAAYQHQIRVVLVLVIALAVGFLYLQLEHQTLSPTRYKLIPTTTYEALQNSQKQPHHKISPKPPVTPDPESDLTDIEDDAPESESFIPEKFQLQAKYLSKVLQTIGDLSRKIEVGENITKPIGGIIEMRTEILKTEEEDEDVPEYMKELGSIINDIKKSKSPPGKRLPKFKPAIKKVPPPPPPPKPKPTEEEEKRRRTKEWDSFMDDLVEALYEGEQEEKLRKGIVDEPPASENKPKRFSMFDDDQEDDEFDLDEEDDDELTPYPPEHYEQLAKDPRTREAQKMFEDVIEDDDKDYEEELARERTRSTIFDDNKEIQESLALLKLMVEARKFVKAAKAMKEAQAKEQEEPNQSQGQDDENSAKPRFQDDNSYTL